MSFPAAQAAARVDIELAARLAELGPTHALEAIDRVARQVEHRRQALIAEHLAEPAPA